MARLTRDAKRKSPTGASCSRCWCERHSRAANTLRARVCSSTCRTHSAQRAVAARLLRAAPFLLPKWAQKSHRRRDSRGAEAPQKEGPPPGARRRSPAVNPLAATGMPLLPSTHSGSRRQALRYNELLTTANCRKRTRHNASMQAERATKLERHVTGNEIPLRRLYRSYTQDRGPGYRHFR